MDAEMAARALGLELRAGVAKILNDPHSYEYEGLSWNAVNDLRALFDIPEPSGAWLADFGNRPTDKENPA